MIVLIATIPLMLLAVAIAAVPLVVVSVSEHRRFRTAVVGPGRLTARDDSRGGSAFAGDVVATTAHSSRAA